MSRPKLIDFKFTFTASPIGRRSGGSTGQSFFSGRAGNPSAQSALRIITESLLKSIGNAPMQNKLVPVVERFMTLVNKNIPEAVDKTTYMRSGRLAYDTQFYIANSSPDGWILKIASNAGHYARVQELGRPDKTGTPTIQETGTNPRGMGGFTIGGGRPYWVPLRSAFGNKPVVVRDAIDQMSGKLLILPKVFRGKYLIAGQAKSYGVASANAARREGRKTGNWSRLTKQTFKPLFAIYVGKTGVAGMSGSKYAKNTKSPGQWLSAALMVSVPEFLQEFEKNKSRYLRGLLGGLGSI
jgi:hypothetical protein